MHSGMFSCSSFLAPAYHDHFLSPRYAPNLSVHRALQQPSEYAYRASRTSSLTSADSYGSAKRSRSGAAAGDFDSKIKSIDPFSGVVTEGKAYSFVPDVALDALSAGSSIPPMVRKGWVVIHHAEPVTRELNMQTLAAGGGTFCVAELRGTVITFFEGVSGVMMNRVFAIDITKYKAWAQDSIHYIEVSDDDRCRVLFSTRQGPNYLHESSDLEHQLWCRALTSTLSAPPFLSGFIRNHDEFPKPWTKLEEGSFGVVYSAKLKGVTPVAVRHVSIASDTDPDRTDETKHVNLLKEVCLSMKMQGPGALQYYGIFWDGDSTDRHESVLDYYIVSEQCAGGNLRDALYTVSADGTMSAKSALKHDVVRQLLLEILSGLMHLHSNSIVHRNIKPTTIALVRPLDQLDHASTGIVKITDLSHCARIPTENEEQPDAATEERVIDDESSHEIGQFHRQLDVASPAVDIFAFGLILFEVVSGEQPWSHLQHLPLHEIEAMVQYGSRPRFKDENMLGIATLVRLCLMPNHDERPSLDDIVARAQHPALFNSFACGTMDEALVGFESEFWAWSTTIYAKLSDAIEAGVLSPNSLKGVPDKVSLTHRAISLCRKYIQEAELPIRVASIVLEALAHEDISQVAKVSPPNIRKFFVDAALSEGRSSCVTLWLLQACSVLIQASPRAADNVEERWLELFTFAIETLTEKEETDDTSKSAGERLTCFVTMMHIAASHHALKTRLTSSEVAVMELIEACATPSLSDTASRSLSEISSNDFVRVVLLRELPQLLKLVKTTSEEVQLRILRLISSATDNPLGATQFVESGGVNVLVPLAGDESKAVAVLLEILGILTKAAVEPALAVNVANDDTVAIIINALSVWVSQETPSEDTAAVGHASLRLASHIVEFPSLQNALADQGLLTLTATALEKHGSSTKEGDEVRLSGCRCVRFLVSTVQSYRVECVKHRVHLQLRDILSTTELHEAVGLETCIHIFSAIGILTSEEEVAQDVMADLAKNDGIHLIVTTMKQLIYEPELQMAGLQAVRAFVRSEKYRPLCEEEGVVSRALQILSAYPYDVPMVKATFELLREVVADPLTRCKAISEGLVAGLVGICTGGSNIANIELTEESVSILAMAADEEQCRRDFERHRFKEILLSLLQGFPNSQRLQHHGSEILKSAFPEKTSTAVKSATGAMFKIVVIGGISVGKTCFVMRGCQNTFSEDVKSTIGVHMDFATIEYPNRHVTLQVYDTAGEERYRAQATSFYRNAHAAVLVYDQTQASSFEELESFREEVLRVVDDDKVLFFVVGSKDDLKEKQAVDQDVASLYARKIDASASFVSAIANTGVHGTFRSIVDALIQKWPNGPPESNRDSVKIGATTEASRGCCA